MPCEAPLRILNPKYRNRTEHDIEEYSLEHFGGALTPPDLYIDVPCGHCHSCCKRRMNEWRIRLLYELSAHPNSIFITLTFDEESLERFRADTNKAVRLFLDRARKYYGKQLRHWFVCEYGTLNGRAHYHGILFDVPDVCHSELAKLWKYGFIYIGYCDERTCKYITKYVTKAITPDQVVPRLITSQGIGESYLTRERIQIHKDTKTKEYRPYISINGFIFPLPTYYRDKIYNKDDKLWLVIQNALKPFERYIGKTRYTDEMEYRRALCELYISNVRAGLSSLRKFATRQRPPKPKKYSQIEQLTNSTYE